MSESFKFLHEYPLFSGLNEDQMHAVMQVCREECFLPNAILFKEGDPAEEIFVLVEGEVVLSTITDNRLGMDLWNRF